MIHVNIHLAQQKAVGPHRRPAHPRSQERIERAPQLPGKGKNRDLNEVLNNPLSGNGAKKNLRL